MGRSEIEVSYNKETFSKYFEPKLSAYPTLGENLIDDFRRHKSGELPSYFGKESIYATPFEIIRSQLWHIHLCIPPKTFPAELEQAHRTCLKGDPDNDIALVYTSGEMNLNKYSLIAILCPDAHQTAKNLALIKYLASVAQRFRDIN